MYSFTHLGTGALFGEGIIALIYWRKGLFGVSSEIRIILVKKKKKLNVPSRTQMLVFGKTRSKTKEEIEFFLHLFSWSWDLGLPSTKLSILVL